MDPLPPGMGPPATPMGMPGMADPTLPPPPPSVAPDLAAMFAATKPPPAPTPPPGPPDADPLERALAASGPVLPSYAGRTAHRVDRAASVADQPIPLDPSAPPAPQRPQSDDARTRKILDAPGPPEIVQSVGRWPRDENNVKRQVAAGAVLTALAQQVTVADPNDADPNGTNGAGWELARADYAYAHDMIGGADAGRFRELYGRFVHTPERLSLEDSTELASMLAKVAVATKGVNDADLQAGGMKVSRVDLTGTGATVRLQGTGPAAGFVKEATVAVPPVAADSLNAVKDLAYLRTDKGMAVISDKATPAQADTLRVLRPVDVGGVQRWVERAGVDRLDAASTLPGDLQTGGQAATVEIHHAMTDPHVATVPGSHIAVRAPNNRTVEQMKAYLAEQGVTDTNNYGGVEVQKTASDGDLQTSGAQMLTATLPDSMTPAQIKAVAQGLRGMGGDEPVAYLHQGMGDGWTRVAEHHFNGPAGQVVIHRSSAPGDINAANHYPAWMLTGDAEKIGAGTSDLNATAPKNLFALPPLRQQDGSYLANNEVRLKLTPPEPTSKVEVAPTWWDSKVDGKRTAFFVLDHPPADIPTVALGATPDGARAGLPATPTTVEGMVRPDRSVAELHVPVTSDGLDLQSLFTAMRTLQRYRATVDPARMRIVGNDGQRYSINGEVTK